jgi:hypothetical protein
MKIAVLSESPADEAAVSILIGGLLDVSIERVSFPEPRTRGWKGVLNAVELVLRHLHYRTDAEALVVTLDSDESPVHRREHSELGLCDLKCRLCQLRTIIRGVQAELRPWQGRGPIRIGLGLAVPAIEAWCLYGTDAHVTESAWIQGLESRSFPYSKRELKQRLYGSTDPVLALETEHLVSQARRLVGENQLALLEKSFPVGFGSLASDIRSWRS